MQARVPAHGSRCLNQDLQDYRISKIRESLVIVDPLSREERFPHHDFYETRFG